jgi:dTDP-4-amino-4,6-dideoxygalactose transaminase
MELRRVIPLLRPQLPNADALLPYLREIDGNRVYANHGPLVQRLEARLTAHYNAPCVVLNSGTSALAAALLAMKPKHKRVLVPAWTFVASAAAIVAAGMEPYFVDVDPDSWQMRGTIAGDVGAMMPVSPFGSPVDTAAWDGWSQMWRIPVLIDGAAGFDSVVPGKSPTMVSLHATKVLGAGEGGFIVSTDEALMERIRQVRNFGGTGAIVGFNGKMSEYHAAVALAALDGWNERRIALGYASARYANRLREIAYVKTVPDFCNCWVSSYCTVLLEGGVGPTQARLAARGIESRRWWGDGAHTHPAFTSFQRDPLPVTESLARRALSLPFSHDMTNADINRVVDAL